MIPNAIDFGAIIYFMIMGLIGSVLHVIIKANDIDDFTSFASLKRLTLGIGSGFIYAFLYSEYNFPNSLMAVASGWIGTDFIIGIMKKFSLGEDQPS